MLNMLFGSVSGLSCSQLLEANLLRASTRRLSFAVVSIFVFLASSVAIVGTSNAAVSNGDGLAFLPLTSTSPSGATSVAADDAGYCTILVAGRVDCWGAGLLGQLGDGKYYTTGHDGSSVAVRVVSSTGGGFLNGVTSIASNTNSFCALLLSHEVVCWGGGRDGQLGNGKFYTKGHEGSAVPVYVSATSGTGILVGVRSLTGGPDVEGGYCALLVSTEVDCWGDGQSGRLGNGKFYKSGFGGSAIPVRVVSASGSGQLSSVSQLVTDGNGDCALLTSSRVDCWGYGLWGELGNGKFENGKYPAVAVPSPVVSTSGKGELDGVSSLASSGGGYCVVLASSAVDCWGQGGGGVLGNGRPGSGGSYPGSGVPVSVVSTSGSGILSGVTSLSTSSPNSWENVTDVCAVLKTGEVDCWGDGLYGELGDGTYYLYAQSLGSSVPVEVVAQTDSGSLTGVSSVASDGDAPCALLESGDVTCWGDGGFGELGDGKVLDSAFPVPVMSTSGASALSHVSDIASDGTGFCAVITTDGGIVCWGLGGNGQLGNSKFYPLTVFGSAKPVPVL
jgi:hypothetical protein